MTKTISHRSRSVSHSNGHRNGQLRTLIAGAKSTASQVEDQASDKLEGLKGRLSVGLSAVKVKAKSIAKVARRQAGRADAKIRSKPYHAMGIAAGVGVIAGLLIARRRSAAR